MSENGRIDPQLTPSAEPISQTPESAGRKRGLRAVFQRWFGRRPAEGLEVSLRWLEAVCRSWEERTTASPAVLLMAGLGMETLMEFGRREAAWRVGRWLQQRQLPDGSLSESRAAEAVFHATAGALRGWLAALPELEQFARPAEKACEFLRRWVGDEGRVMPTKSRSWNYEPDSVFTEPPDLSPLLAGGRRWPDTDWTTAALRGIEYWLRHGHRRFPAEQSAALVRRANLYLEWGRRAEALPLVEKLDKRQLPSGAVPETEDGSLVLASTVAQAALVWFRLFNRQRGEQAIRFLEKRRQAEGGFLKVLAGTSEGRQEEDPLAAKYFLDATFWRIRATYRERIKREPALDPEDPRLACVRSFLRDVPRGSIVADLGCGTGRYLRLLANWLPELRWVGIDLVPEALEQIPRGIQTIEGNLLRIPVPDQAFHAVFSIDAVSHTPLPQQAVVEIARVTRRGGKILIIDQWKSESSAIDPWEQPVGIEQIRHWLAPLVADMQVQSFPLSAGPMRHVQYGAISARRAR